MEARISAKWTVLTEDPRRESAPPIFIRQEQSPPVHTDAPVASLVKALNFGVLNTFNGAHQILLTGSQVQQAHAVA